MLPDQRRGEFLLIYFVVALLALPLWRRLAPWLLSIGGWQDGAETQSDYARMSLVVIYSWVPCVLKGIAVAMMWGFPDLDKHATTAAY